ncbi:MAG: tyrosine-type recombinase/integrase [Rhodospirillales bacterium]|nr:tyrosine-type recombinase/integrase [Rhodospirillales bacterium]
MPLQSGYFCGCGEMAQGSRRRKRLTDAEIRKAKPRAQRYRIPDYAGLAVEISPASTDAEPRKFWRYRYRINGKENLFAAGEWCAPPIGETPEQRRERIEGGRMTLEEARRARLEWRGQVRAGQHPRLVRVAKRLETAQSSATTFRAVTLEYVEKRGGAWGASYRRNFMGFMERDAFPDLGDLPIATLMPVHMLTVLQKVEGRGSVTAAHHGRSFLSAVFRYAVQTFKMPIDPMPSLRGSLGKMNSQNHGRLARHEIGPFLHAVRSGGRAERVTEIAVELLLLTMLRTIELRGGWWHEIDWPAELWRIPAERMKKKRPHIVPLSAQAVSLLKELRNITGNAPRLFPNVRDVHRPMAPETIRHAFKRAGYGGRFTPHGCRGTAATLLRENGSAREHVEIQLAHQRGNSPYDHAAFIQERRKMLAWWADLIDAEVARQE